MEVGSPIAEKTLKALGVSFAGSVEIMRKDSLFMTDEDRDEIANAISLCKFERIVITHGTDTMALSAIHTKKLLHSLNQSKTVVFVGAITPYALPNSDAAFNLEFSFAMAKASPPGVYVAMNGTLFECESVRKNKPLGIFEAIPLNR